ncbi:nucleoside diphosphate kinase 2, chloroplastic-like isoform X1 [Malus sylvestris]|uniref:nucleoside diphosphate kinase 2, chloroplastic-like isoform X1 n=1 Tax=Malus sylvestris TaxID=3752 RepID=UPI0021ACAAD7|nr:nucleoside diphosphate kinase 2, chloroplastic-like isoform X1 [Malus sylvestris]
MDEQGTSYSPPPPTLSTCSNLTSAHRNSNLRTSHHQLSAFPSNLHLFSYFAARSHAKTLAKPRIFLPHLVASLEQVDETDIMVKPDGVQRGLNDSVYVRSKQYQLEALPVPPRLSRGSKIQSLSAQEKPTTSRASKNGFLRMNCRK